MNLKDKLRMGFLIVIFLVVAYILVYYFYDGTDRSGLGKGILVEYYDVVTLGQV